MNLFVSWIESPIGFVRMARTAGGALAALVFDEQWGEMRERLVKRFDVVDFEDAGSDVGDDNATARVCAYFAGDLAALDAIEVDVAGTPFQRAVWESLGTIPAGETRSYSQLAYAVGAPKAVRAVGTANGQNPVSLVIPCHRAIGKGGAMHGYAGGVDRKRWLLAHEARYAVRRSAPSTSATARFSQMIA